MTKRPLEIDIHKLRMNMVSAISIAIATLMTRKNIRDATEEARDNLFSVEMATAKANMPVPEAIDLLESYIGTYAKDATDDLARRIIDECESAVVETINEEVVPLVRSWLLQKLRENNSFSKE